MRKIQIKQAKECTALLRRAHNEIKKALETKDTDVVLELLEQCQSAAIEIGEMIEAAEGEECAAIPFLESYCELVYQTYEQVRQLPSLNPYKIQKKLNKELVPFENSIQNDISVQTEAVFLPYKASMWDSLESVWKAADEDPDCMAYVIPIPYYDKNPDGSFRELHYEGDLYPDYVPVTRYDEYDFEARHPDMIFIHNPYDNANYVTSVHPFFYSDNLKKYTEKLIYIPYFILGEIDPEDKAAVEGIAHFCTTPAVIHADKVIVQSENMRKVYIEVMADLTKDNPDSGMDRKYWEEKILGIGSPKMDKVLSVQEEDVKIPGDWLKVINRPDGSRKKIIFYNTGVSALLQHNEKMLEKMRNVFQIFKENQDEVALLWRPHPLIKATIESMRPDLWEEYSKIVEDYRKEGWGIYDDTADMDRAIVISDGYYGDPSSLVQLYLKTGKPVMMQDVEM